MVTTLVVVTAFSQEGYVGKNPARPGFGRTSQAERALLHAQP